MFRAEFRETLDAPWTALEPVGIGAAPPGESTPDIIVTVTRDEIPILRIDVYQREPAHYAFQDAIIWGEFIVIGFGGHVHLVSIASHRTATLSLDGYFGHLYPAGDHLLAADATRLHCFGRDGRVVWQSRALGIDGVLVHGVEDGVVTGVAQVELPIDFSDLNDVGNWSAFRLLLASGRDAPC